MNLILDALPMYPYHVSASHFGSFIWMVL